jgi:hypothetical protein
MFLFQERQQLVAAGAVLLGGEQFAPRLLTSMPLSSVELVIGVEAFAKQTLHRTGLATDRVHCRSARNSAGIPGARLVAFDALHFGLELLGRDDDAVGFLSTASLVKS